MQGDGAHYGPAALERNPVPAPGRPWGLAVGLLAAMGVLFFSSYGVANWLASQRADVAYFHFSWEREIPFVPWTIVPYWSIDLLYGISFFLWSTRAGLLTHVKRLLAAQLVSVACFIAFPLRFAFARPEADGLPGQLFTLLGGFDKPFNQAPSLHISLLVILWVAYATHLRGGWRWLLHLWFVLIGVSVLTTYQHHFIDLPTGWLIGWLCVFAFPPVPAVAAAGTPDVGLARRYGLAAALLVLASVAALSVSVVAGFLVAWAAIALGCVAMIYRAGKPGAFQKRADGTLPMSAWWVLWPYVLGAFANSRWWTRRQPAVSRLTDGVWIGRLPGKAELRESAADAVLDLSAELPRLVTGVSYRCVPVLDLTVPSQAQLRVGVETIDRWRQEGRTVLVSCALGYSRSALVAAAWLGAHAQLRDPQQVLALLRKSRPAVVLGPPSVAALTRFLQAATGGQQVPDSEGAAHAD